MPKFKEIKFLPPFERDLKKLIKRFQTLGEDLKIFIEKGLFSYHKLHIDNGGIFSIPDLRLRDPRVRVFKAKKFACRALKGRGAQSGIRVIYAYFENSDRIELIELYFKGDKENEDRERIRDIYG